MKRPRFGSRDRLSRDAAELQRLATGLAESGSRIEDAWWEKHLAELVDQLLEEGREDDLSAAIERLFEGNPRAHDELADMLESRAETVQIEVNGQSFEILLFVAPLLAWSRYAIPSGPLPRATVDNLQVQLGAHVFSRQARVALADYFFSPDQLPRSFCDTWRMTRELGAAALAGECLRVDAKAMPETNRFLSDVRYLVGAVALPAGRPPFHWNEVDGNRETALAGWIRQGCPNLEPLLAGCAFQPLLPNAYHMACREADKASRPYSVQSAVAFLNATLGLAPEQMSAVIGSFFDRRLEEFRIGLSPLNRDQVYHGMVWPLFGPEDDTSDIASEIETVLRECGIKDIVTLDHRFPMEFCDDCGAPMFPNREGELIHAEMPEQKGESTSATLH